MEDITPNSNDNKNLKNSKLDMGILFAAIFGLIGLFIGLKLYPAATTERKTFLTGWSNAFVTLLVITIIIFAFSYSIIKMYI